ncbi:MAG: carbonic anhydrase [Oscillospiraceae bacterium]|nr:carbonic anhydrase [Oscillospiraceae bacterium]
MVTASSAIEILKQGNKKYTATVDKSLLKQTAENGQHPYAIVICCSDSRVIPEQIFHSRIGDLFVIRVAGNVLDNHQLGSIEYAAAHFGIELIVMLGHTGCGAVKATLQGGGDGFVRYITDDIAEAVGEVRDFREACRLNTLHGVERIRAEFDAHPEIDAEVVGALYDIETGNVEWL